MQPNLVYVNGIDLNSITYFEVDKRLPLKLPDRNVQIEYPARGHGGKPIQANYRSKQITILGHISAPDRDALDIVTDALKFALQGTELSLDVVQGGVLRTYTVTVEDGGGGIDLNVIERGVATVTLNFVAADPFGRDTLQTALTFTNPKTTAVSDSAVTIGGSWLAELNLTVVMTTITGGTAKTYSVSNPTTGESMSVTRTYTSGDVLSLDVRNRLVAINGASVDYLGVFPHWQPGTGIIRLTDDFTTRSVSLSASYYKRYL